MLQETHLCLKENIKEFGLKRLCVLNKTYLHSQPNALVFQNKRLCVFSTLKSL